MSVVGFKNDQTHGIGPSIAVTSYVIRMISPTETNMFTNHIRVMSRNMRHGLVSPSCGLSMGKIQFTAIEISKNMNKYPPVL